MSVTYRKAVTDLTLQASASNTAGSTATGTELDCDKLADVECTAKITNGATGPTVACGAKILYRYTTTGTQYTLGPLTAGVANNGVYEMRFRIPNGAVKVQSVFTGNTGQTVTVECYGAGIQWTDAA